MRCDTSSEGAEAGSSRQVAVWAEGRWHGSWPHSPGAVVPMVVNAIRRVSVELDSGCIYISGAVEFDDRPGPVRDALVSMVRAWHSALEKAIRLAVAEGHLQPDTDVMQMLFEVHGLILALHHDARFLRQPGALDRAHRAFDNVLAHYLPSGAAAASRPRRR